MKDFFKKELKSGLNVLFERREMPLVSILIGTRVGAAYESQASKGLAHFFEHMLFKGSETRGQEEISRAIEKVGGILNGFTSEQITAFWCKMPKKHFSLGSEILLDMVARPKVDIKELEKERGVILQEINMVHDSPRQFLMDKMKEISYEKPFALPILGKKENILKFKRHDFLKWHDLYSPNNLIFSVVGNASFPEILEACKNFEKILKVKNRSLPQLNLRKKIGDFVEKRKHIDQAHLGILFHVPNLSEKGRYSAEVMNAILGEGMSSRLFQEVREKRGLAYAIKTFLEQEKNYGHCIIYAGVEKRNLRKAKEIILKEMKKMSNISKKELEDAKEQCIGGFEVESEQSDMVAANLLMQEIATKAEEYYRYNEMIKQVTLEDVKRVMKIKGCSLGMIVPC